MLPPRESRGFPFCAVSALPLQANTTKILLTRLAQAACCKSPPGSRGASFPLTAGLSPQQKSLHEPAFLPILDDRHAAVPPTREEGKANNPLEKNKHCNSFRPPAFTCLPRGRARNVLTFACTRPGTSLAAATAKFTTN